MSDIETGSVEPIVALVLDQFGVPIIMSHTIKARVWRVSDGEHLDWSDMMFRPAVDVITPYKALDEVDRDASPGEYRLDLDTGAILNPTPNDIYEVTVIQDSEDTPANLPQVGEIRVGKWVDKVGQSTYQVNQSYSYDPATQALTGLIWAERAGLIVGAPTSATISWYDADGTHLFTSADPGPDAQGFFKIAKTIALDYNRSYYSIAQITIPGAGVVSGGKGIFTLS